MRRNVDGTRANGWLPVLLVAALCAAVSAQAIDRRPGRVGAPGDIPASIDAREAVTAPTIDDDVDGIRISEIMANTPGSSDVEWVELVNVGTATRDLTGWYLLDDNDQHEPCVLDGTLAPGERLVVAGNVAAFLAIWDVPNLHPTGFDGPAGFALGNDGDAIRLFRPTPLGDALVHGFTFGLQGENVPFGFLHDDGDAPEYLGRATPGAPNTTAGTHSPVCINEFLTTSALGGIDDWIELFNRSDATVDISGWRLSDAAGPDGKYTFPTGTLLPAGGYLSVDESELGFSLSSTGSEVIQLIHADGVTGQDYFDFGPQYPDVSTGRAPDGTPFWHLLNAPSRGAENVCLARITYGLVFVEPTALEWSAGDAATGYDVVRGQLESLLDAWGDFATAGLTCLASGLGETFVGDPALPPPGAAYFYLVRTLGGGCATGSYDAGDAAQVAGRDPQVALAAGGCPP